ncbi:hypothetical protein HXX01_04325 [Candidatus Nomurabacteria bacterium]|nr:hypothetical protein [Candidatus Nomurabacteria bacterium]
MISHINPLQEQELNKKHQYYSASSTVPKLEQMETGKDNYSGFTGFDPKKFNDTTEHIKKMNKEIEKSVKIGKAADNTFGMIGDTIISMAQGTKGAFKSMVMSILDAIRGIINGLLAQAIAAMIAKESHKGLPGLALAAVGIIGIEALFARYTKNFELGGIVPGSSYSGDNIPINVNSGEMIINRNDQSKLWSAIKSGGFSSGFGELQLTHRISGEELEFVIQKANRKNNAIR